MKTAIVYYSLNGNTKYAAQKIADILKAKGEVDVIRIEPQTAYPDKGAKKFLWCGKSAVMGECPVLVPYEFNAEDYDRIIIGTPVWASTFTPPIRTFINENTIIRQKQVAVFTCFSGGGAEKAIEKMKNYIGVDRFEAQLILIDPEVKKKDEDNRKISEFCFSLS